MNRQAALNVAVLSGLIEVEQGFST